MGNNAPRPLPKGKKIKLRHPALTAANPIILTKEELTQIYTRWIADHREHPEEFYSDEHRKTSPLDGYVEDSVRYFLELLKEIRG